VTLTISTTAAIPAVAKAGVLLGMALPLVGILWPGLQNRVRTALFSKRRRILAIVATFFTALSWVSCSGGLQGGGGGNGSPGTPPGTYTITLSATSGTVTHSTPVTLIVTP
jgi:hypothetical protein